MVNTKNKDIPISEAGSDVEVKKVVTKRKTDTNVNKENTGGPFLTSGLGS